MICLFYAIVPYTLSLTTLITESSEAAFLAASHAAIERPREETGEGRSSADMAEAEAVAGLVVAADDNARAAFDDCDGDGAADAPQREVGLISNGNGDHAVKENG
jgi:hypothetical protein